MQVRAPLSEWANVLQMPWYPTLAKSNELTNTFRAAYVGLAHDAPLQRMKEAAYRFALNTPETSDEEEEWDERPAAPPRPQGQNAGPLHLPNTGPAPADRELDCGEVKKIKGIVRPRKEGEDLVKCLKAVWPLVSTNTNREEAKRLWLPYVTSSSFTSVQAHHQRLVNEDEEDEEEHVERGWMKLKGGQTRARVWHRLQLGDAKCCMCAKGLKKVGHLWRAALWWCDDCFSRNSSNVMASGILLDEAQDLPLQYTAEDADDLHDALLLWTAPKHIPKWDDPEESRLGRYYDLHVSIRQMSNGQRRHVVKVRNNSLMLRVSALPPANHEPLAEGTTHTPGTTAFALVRSGARYLQVWKDVFPFLYKVDKEAQKAQKERHNAGRYLKY